MKFVVTGATGMIGRALINKILSAGDSVVALVNPLSGRLSSVPSGAEIIKADLSDYKDLNPAEKADCFIHLAWGKTDCFSRDNVSAQQKNIEYTLAAVRLAKRFGCKSFLGAGSQAEYGVKSVPLAPDTPTEPLSEYGKAKLAAGSAAKKLCADTGLRFNWVRILSVYGEGDSKTTLISYIIDCFLKGVPPVLTKCEQLWDYIYCEDCASAIYLAATRGKNGAIYPIGGGRCRPLKEYVLDAAKAAGYTGEIKFGEKDYYPHQPMFLCADISALTQDTGFTPQYTFKQGIEKVIKYRKENL